MKTMRLAILAAAFAALAALAPGALAYDYNGQGATTIHDGRDQQNAAGFDTADASGGWSNTDVTVAHRPYIRFLGITNPGFPETVVVDNRGDSPEQSPYAEELAPGAGVAYNVYAFVHATNSCPAGTTQATAPAGHPCYDTPNRVGISLSVNRDRDGWSRDNGFSDVTPNTIIPNVTTDSIVHLIIGFHSEYSTLRWTWVSGEPTYWRSTVKPGTDGEVELKFRPSDVPSWSGDDAGCTRIPVETCEVAKSDSEVLSPQIILSMDNTLDASLAGSVFGTDSAKIGSLVLEQPGGKAPTVNYGIAAPHAMPDSTPRKGTFYALLPSPLLAVFGTGVEVFDATTLSLARNGDAGTYTKSWTAWNAADNGTAGEFLKISDISFSAPRFEVKPKLSLKAGTSITVKAVAKARKMKAGKYSAVSKTKAICTVKGGVVKAKTGKRGTCKLTVTSRPKSGAKQTKKVWFLVYR